MTAGLVEALNQIEDGLKIAIDIQGEEELKLALEALELLPQKYTKKKYLRLIVQKISEFLEAYQPAAPVLGNTLAMIHENFSRYKFITEDIAIKWTEVLKKEVRLCLDDSEHRILSHTLCPSSMRILCAQPEVFRDKIQTDVDFLKKLERISERQGPAFKMFQQFCCSTGSQDLVILISDKEGNLINGFDIIAQGVTNLSQLLFLCEEKFEKEKNRISEEVMRIFQGSGPPELADRTAKPLYIPHNYKTIAPNSSIRPAKWGQMELNTALHEIPVVFNKRVVIFIHREHDKFIRTLYECNVARTFEDLKAKITIRGVLNTKQITNWTKKCIKFREKEIYHDKVRDITDVGLNINRIFEMSKNLSLENWFRIIESKIYTVQQALAIFDAKLGEFLWSFWNEFYAPGQKVQIADLVKAAKWNGCEAIVLGNNGERIQICIKQIPISLSVRPENLNAIMPEFDLVLPQMPTQSGAFEEFSDDVEYLLSFGGQMVARYPYLSPVMLDRALNIRTLRLAILKLGMYFPEELRHDKILRIIGLMI